MNVIWFRRGLRLHDNPALHSAVENAEKFFAVYIFDTTFQDTGFKPYHQSGFLLECLVDLNESLESVGSKLHVFRGCPLEIFRYLHSQHRIRKLCFEEQCEPIYHERDSAIESLCRELNIERSEHVSHTLWDPLEVIRANGDTPPITYDMFVHVAMSIGEPPKPVADVVWKETQFINLESIETSNFKLFSELPTASEIGLPEVPTGCRKHQIFGGEKNALEHMKLRLQAEEAAFRRGFYQPNQARPNLLDPPLSLSAAIATGAISVRLFYWKIYELFNRVNSGRLPFLSHITGQLIWREYFYTASRKNPDFGRNFGNPACLPIVWNEDEEAFKRWKEGRTGYPFIDAGQRQLLQEGWMHHSVRNAVAVFLTRGDLWLSWELGADHMATYLVDSDWAVNNGNWLWVSNSAFERILSSPICIDAVSYGRRLEPSGDYIRQYVPELAKFPFEYVHEPWKAPLEVQRAAGCIIGSDYPERIVIHEEASARNQRWMEEFRKSIIEKYESAPSHFHPSSESEVYKFFCIAEDSRELGH